MNRQISDVQVPAIYEDVQFIALCEGALRPGGLPLTLEAVAKAGLQPGASLLDVCCGLGESVAALREAGYQAEGVDASAILVEKGHALGRNIHRGNAYEIKGQYDGLLYECSLSLLEDKEKALTAAYRALKPQGRLIVADLYPRRSAEQLSVPCITCLNGVIPRELLQRHMDAAGFTQVLWEDKTDLYKQFIASLIMEYGSVAGFFHQFIGDCADADATAQAVRSVKLGYFLSIWRKKDGAA